MAGRAILAIAVSSEASASVVKIAATAQRRSSGGRPSIGGTDGFTVVGSNIAIGFSARDQAPLGACTTDAGRATGARLHDAYANRMALYAETIGLRSFATGEPPNGAKFRPSAPYPRADFRIPSRRPNDRLGLPRIATAIS